MQDFSESVDEQLNALRQRLREIRVAKKWLQEYRINAPIGISGALSSYYTYLEKQEKNTIAMGKRLKQGAS